MSGIEREISQTAARGDLKRLGSRPIKHLLTHVIKNDPTFEKEIPRTVSQREIEDICAFLQSFTHDPSVGRRIPQNRRCHRTFADFTNVLIEPFILEEITGQMQDTKSYLLKVAENYQHAFETGIMQNANLWMEYPLKNFRQLVISDQMLLKLLEALEQAAAHGNPTTLRMSWL